jgi:L-seryl-tRNA(Ser) seleniumtransferase
MNHQQTQPLRQLPAVDRVLRDARIEAVCEQCGRTRVREWIRQVLDELRSAGIVGDSPSTLMRQVVDSVLVRAERSRRDGLQRIINGTGVLLQTNLGRAPLAQRAIDAINEAARYVNVEFDLESGHRSRRGEALERMFRELTGAEAALVVNNCAAATLLVLRTLAGDRHGGTAQDPNLAGDAQASMRTQHPGQATGGGEVVISRGELIEIGGSYRLPDVFREAGVTLREVGTTNRTRLADYEEAITDQTRGLLKAHQSNFRQIGFTESVPLTELARLARSRSLPLIADIGSGCVYDLSPYGLGGEPTIRGSLEAGADLVLFSGDKLFGGPQAGVILGRGDLVERIRRSPLTRALRIDKLTTAALEATLTIYLSGRAFEEIPILKALAQSPDELHARAVRVQQRIMDQSTQRPAGSEPASPCAAPVTVDSIEVVPVESAPGGGSLPGETLPGWALALNVPRCEETARRLRLGSPPVLTRIHRNQVLIDMRTLLPEEEPLLIERFVTF